VIYENLKRSSKYISCLNAEEMCPFASWNEATRRAGLRTVGFLDECGHRLEAGAGDPRGRGSVFCAICWKGMMDNEKRVAGFFPPRAAMVWHGGWNRLSDFTLEP
jgi:hypothetical protein